LADAISRLFLEVELEDLNPAWKRVLRTLNAIISSPYYKNTTNKNYYWYDYIKIKYPLFAHRLSPFGQYCTLGIAMTISHR
jgi:hypothetical protein